MDIEELVKLAYLLNEYCELKGVTERQSITTVIKYIDSDIKSFDDGE